MYKVLVSAPYLLTDIDLFRTELAEKEIEIDVYPVEERLEESDLLPIIDQYDGVICGDDRFTPKVIDKASKLKAIVKWGTGIDSIDKVYAESKRIKVCNTLNAFTEPVSDSILSIVLAFSRRMFISDRLMKDGKWEKAFGVAMDELTLGIVGLGNIGKAVARKCKAFNTKVLANDIIEFSKEVTADLNVQIVDFDKLLKESDFVILCCDLNSSSKYIMSAPQYKKMKNSAIVINVARGPLVNELDIVEALQSEEIAGAGLDVFEHEPLPVDSPLRKMDNVILSSHNVNASPKAWNRVHRNSLEMLYKELFK